MSVHPQPVKYRDFEQLILSLVGYHQQSNKIVTIAVIDLVEVHGLQFVTINGEETAQIIVDRCPEQQTDTIIVDETGKLSKTVFHSASHHKARTDDDIVKLQEFYHLGNNGRIVIKVGVHKDQNFPL